MRLELKEKDELMLLNKLKNNFKKKAKCKFLDLTGTFNHS